MATVESNRTKNTSGRPAGLTRPILSIQWTIVKDIWVHLPQLYIQITPHSVHFSDVPLTFAFFLVNLLDYL